MYKIIYMLLFINLIYAKEYAFLIGIDKYKNINSLNGAVNDVLHFKNILIKKGVDKNNIYIFLDENATKINILNNLEKLSEKIEKNDIFYFYYAGHGSKLDKFKNKTIFNTYNFSKDDSNSYIVVQNDLKPIFKKIDKKVKYAIAFIDSCFAGYSYKGALPLYINRYKSRYYKGPIKVDDNFKIKDDKYNYKKIVFAISSRDNEESYEDILLKRGLFSLSVEKCILEYSPLNVNSLKSCLDTIYNYNYVLKAPPNFNFNFLDVKTSFQKIKLYSTKRYKELYPIVEYVDNFINLKDFILKKSGNSYVLESFPLSIVVNNFKSLKDVKRFLNSYRLIKLNSFKNANININITYLNSTKTNYKILKPNSTIKINIISNKSGYLTLFSLNKYGKVYLIEKNLKIKNSYTIDGVKTGSIEGIDYLKALITKNRLNFNDIELNEKGEVLNLEKLYNILRDKEFYESSRNVLVLKGAKE